MIAARARLARRLHAFVEEACTDTVARRRLRYRPREALTAHALAIPAGLPTELPIKHYLVDARFDEAHLFGEAPAPARLGPPSLDLRLLEYGVKPMALAHGPEADMAARLRWAEQRGLRAVLGPWQLDVQEDVGKGYTNFAQPQPARAGSGKWRTLVVSADEGQLVLGWLSLLFRWDTLLGRLLGYPPCCVEAFQTRWPVAAESHQGDLVPLLLDADGVGPFDGHSSPLARYFGAELVQHFPCSLRCEATAAIARRYASTLAVYEPHDLPLIRELLCAPTVYTETDGVFVLVGARAEPQPDGAYTVHYDAAQVVTSDPGSQTASALAQASALVHRDGVLRAGDAELRGRLVLLADLTQSALSAEATTPEATTPEATTPEATTPDAADATIPRVDEGSTEPTAEGATPPPAEATP